MAGVYIQRTDCTEQEVNDLIAQGYVPAFITPVREEVSKEGRVIIYNTKLIYHFLKRKPKEEPK